MILDREAEFARATYLQKHIENWKESCINLDYNMHPLSDREWLKKKKVPSFLSPKTAPLQSEHPDESYSVYTELPAEAHQ